MLSAHSFFDLSSWGHPELIRAEDQVWLALKNLKSYLESQRYTELTPSLVQNGEPLKRTLVYYDNTLLDDNDLTIEYDDATKSRLKVFHDGKTLTGASVIMAGAVLSGGHIKIGKGVLIEPGALIKSPTIIGDQTEVRHGAYIRGNCLIGSNCVVGHVTEVKHSIFLDGAKAGHFAYLGDSILGNQVNLGAGTKLANLRFIKGDIAISTPEGKFETGLRKLGAILGDNVQTGCNTVTNPGTLLGKKSMVIPNTTVPSGYHVNSSLIRYRKK
jgi:UDP-N-acetylglucosamine diphosphorylase / glucose-1-phosphate thymidylyltransferase / UDP-N-acetylgalactosamine diphosphorylase / glucosamine-1-phosphate N-acetyltransferase / galactosamine-1-phosphate N-acetyltransferase